MNARILPAVIAALLSVTACSSASDSDADGDVDTPSSIATAATDASADESADATTTDTDSNTVSISQSRFDNAELRVAAGTTVTFVNNDPFAHTVTSRDGAPVEFDSGDLGQDETFEFTFDQPGEYAYFCQIHPTMRAVVIVE